MKDNRQEVIENLKGKQKFIILSIDRGEIDLYDVYAKDEDELWEIVNEEIASNYSQDILLSPEEFNNLKDKINKFEV